MLPSSTCPRHLAPPLPPLVPAYLCSSLAANMYTSAPVPPMMTAAYDMTMAQLAVMLTAPARMPLSSGPMSPGLPLNTDKKRQVRPPAPVASVVLTATCAATLMQP